MTEKWPKKSSSEQNRWAFSCNKKTTTSCGYVGLQANVSTVGLFANKYIASNHEWNTGNYAIWMH